MWLASIWPLMPLFLCFDHVTPVPVIIRSGIIKSHNHGHHGQQEESGNVYDGEAGNAGTNEYEHKSGFDKLNQGQFVKAEDAGSYEQKDADKKTKHDQGAYVGEDYHQNGEGLVTDEEAKAGHKKGHHKSGFHNTYHKDESGSNSSYFDDENDEGGKYKYHGLRGNQGGYGRKKQQGGYEDGSHHAKDDSRRGSYNKGGHLDENLGRDYNYDDERYRNERKQHGKTLKADQYSGGGENVAGGHHNQVVENQQPHYTTPYYYNNGNQHHQPPPPLPAPPTHPLVPQHRQPLQPENYYEPERKIIIYEDPRVYENNLQYASSTRAYDHPSDRVRLDVRPPRQRQYYYEQRPAYDDYYY